MNFKRTVEELRAVASIFWPEELSGEAAEQSVIPYLLDTQEQFLSLLSLPVASLGRFFDLLALTELSSNLFLKHLMVLTDMGGELLQRINDNFHALFPEGVLEYEWAGQLLTYRFEALPLKGSLSTNRLRVSGRKLLHPHPLDSLLQDVIVLLIFGGASTNLYTAHVLAQCEINRFLGRPDELRHFVKQRYIWVSRITSGSQTNLLGQLAQQFVLRYVRDNLALPEAIIKPNAGITGISQTAAQRLTSFDLVIQRGERCVAVEVSFQVTTNSVIERKAGQAQARYQQIHDAGHQIAYVLDGAGNFVRQNALANLCAYSDCTVAFTRSELDVLCEFIRITLTK